MSSSKNAWRECEVAALLGSQKSSAISQWPTVELQAVAKQLPQDNPLVNINCACLYFARRTEARTVYVDQ